MAREKELLNDIQLTASRSRVSVLFRNNTGQGWAGIVVKKTASMLTLQDFRPLRAGLVKGSSDLIGWTEVIITPEMVGRKMAVFTAFEAKTSGRLSPDQLTFLTRIDEAGGIAAEIRDAAQVSNIIEFFKAGK